MSKLTTSDVNHPQYNEAEALQQLLQAADAQLEAANALRDDDQDTTALQQFSISIGGQSIAFLLGGPQAAALEAFVQHVSCENLYLVDAQQLTVTE
jgi:hypothetical protein